MVDRLMKEWEQWSKAQADAAAATAVSTAAQLPKSPTAKSDAARAEASLLVEAAPPALTVRGVERDSQISFFVQLMTVMPAAAAAANSDCDSSDCDANSGSNGHSQHSFSSNSSSTSTSAAAKHPVLVYHVCESSVPPWIQLRNGCGSLTGSHSDGLIEVEIDANKMEFQERQNGAGWLPVCAMLVVTLEPQETATANGTSSSSNSGSSPQHSPKLGGAHAVRRIIVPVVMTLKA
jgi:hypothetical protein